MSELRAIADSFDAILQSKKVEKYTYSLTQSEKQELNIENGDFKLMRTVFNNSGTLKVFIGNRMGNVKGNDITEEGLAKLADDGLAAAESAEEDPCHDIAPDQGTDVFRQGLLEPDMDRFFERVKELLATTQKEYPKINLMAVIASYDRWHWVGRSTNGTEFEGFGGQYGIQLEFNAIDGEVTTGINGCGFVTKDLDTPFIDLYDVRQEFENTQNSLYTKSVEGKFEGTVVMTPVCVTDFLSMLASNYMDSGVIINGTSQWLDKVGEKVADEKLTVALKPYDERIVMGERGTQDGFRSEDVTLIDHGVLKAHLLNLYASKKTGRPMIKNTGSDMVVEAGDKSLAEIITSVDRGLLMGGFSGGQPGVNGEFSGVAKNSFLIENGKVTSAVMETMVNGNLGDIFANIRAISKEQLCDGMTVVPYIAFDGIVISGK